MQHLATRSSILAALLVLLCMFQSITIAETKESKEVKDEEYRILFLSSYSYSWDSTLFQMEGVLQSLQGNHYVLNYEFMDAKNINYDEGYGEFYEQLKLKLQTRPTYDGIIVADDEAFRFMTIYKEELFPKTPIVFEGVDHIDLAMEFAKDPFVTGIVEEMDYSKNIELAHSLYPDATKLIFMYNEEETGVLIADQLKEASLLIKKYEIEYINTSAYSKEAYIEKLKGFQKDSIVFGISVGEQNENIVYSGDESYKVIEKYAKVPIFTVGPVGVGSGLFGGYMIDHKASGILIGEMMKSILTKNSYPPVMLETPSIYYFDYKIKQQYSIPTSLLPTDALIINQPENILEKHAKLIILILTIGLLFIGVNYYFRHRANRILKDTYNQLVVTEANLQVQYDNNKENLEALIEQEAHIRYQAEHDDLTNLPNRRIVMGRMNQLIEEKVDFTIILVNIDDFKEVNDLYGHVLGDAILKALAERFSQLVTEECYVARFGGDEFLFIIEAIDDEKTNAMVAKLQGIIAHPVSYNGVESKVKMSIGIADSHHYVEEASDIVSNAVMALYEGKKGCKNSVVYYDEPLRKRLAKFKNILDLLNRACDEDGFELLFQPQVDVLTDRVCSYEALVRLKGSAISPAVFIPVAEESGLIVKIGRIVTKKAIEQLVEWRKQGMVLYPLAINFSTRQIKDKDYVNYLKELLERNNISPNLIEIEFTESIFMENDDKATTLFEAFKKQGIRMALDDFGTGYSSIGYLTYIPVEKVKLDKSFVEVYLEKGEFDFIENIIRLSHSLGLKITVEGVEEKAQYDKLKELGCDYVQGYYFSKPIDGIEVEDWLKK